MNLEIKLAALMKNGLNIGHSCTLKLFSAKKFYKLEMMFLPSNKIVYYRRCEKLVKNAF